MELACKQNERKERDERKKRKEEGGVYRNGLCHERKRGAAEKRYKYKSWGLLLSHTVLLGGPAYDPKPD